MRKQLPFNKTLKKISSFLLLLLVLTLTLSLNLYGTSFLPQVEAATYTAGVTTVGPVMDSGNNNGISATQVTTGSTGGTLDNINVRIGNVNAAPENHMRVAIYADTGSDQPGARLGVSNSQVLTANSWNTFILTSSVTIAANTKYWLAFNVDGGNTQYALERNVAGAVSAWKIPTNYGTWPNPFGTPSSTTSEEQYSIYMTYTSVAPTATPTVTPTPTPGGSQTYTSGYQTWNGTFDSGNNDIISATQITSGANGGTSQSISIYMGSVTASPNNHIQVGIYADNGSNNPGALLGSSTSQVITPNSWNTIALPNVTINPNTKYFLAFNLDGSTTQFGWNSTTTGISRWKFTTTFGTWPSTFGTPSLSQNQQYAVNLTYTGPTATPTPPGTLCNVVGGTSTNPTNLGNTINTQTNCTEFVLGDGYYAPTVVSRNDITIRAANACAAQVQPELAIGGQNVTVDGVSITGDATSITISKPGVKVLNNCLQGFGKQSYANGIWVFQEALDPNNKVIIQGNKLDDWGGAMYSGGIAIGKADDNYNIPTAISVEVRNNTITNGPTALGIYNAAIQSFHPFLAYKNYVDRLSHAAVQNKTFNSRVACNEFSHITQDGALYNRLGSNNVWEYNRVHDSEFGIDHFMGDNTVLRGNVIYNNQYLGRVKNEDIGSTNVTFENNTFYGSTAWAGFIWDNNGGGPLSNILWRNNIFQNVNGQAINTDASLDPVWDEYSNIFYNTIKPSGTTGEQNGTSIIADPGFVNPPVDFTVTNPLAQGKGAPWPLPCP